MVYLKDTYMSLGDEISKDSKLSPITIKLIHCE